MNESPSDAESPLSGQEPKRATEAWREEAQFVEALYRIGILLAAELDLQRLVQVLTDEATALTGAQFGSFFYNVTNAQGESYLLYTLSGIPREAFAPFPMPRNTAVFGPTFRGEGVVRSGDITQDRRYGHSAPFHGMPHGHPPVRSYLAAPVTSRAGEVLGGLFFGHAQAGVFAERHERILVTLCAQAAVAIDNARLYQAGQDEIAERRRVEQELQASKEQQQILLRDVLASVTEGKLLISNTPALLPVTRPPVGEPIHLTEQAGLWELRHRAMDAALAAGHSGERCHDLATAASEAGMNAIVHGGGGTAKVSVSQDGVVQVRVEDQGKGIAVENLPRAALARGFSTKSTLGHGLKMMLETADRVYLMTGPAGTTVVIEQDQVAPIPIWLSGPDPDSPP